MRLGWVDARAAEAKMDDAARVLVTPATVGPTIVLIMRSLIEQIVIKRADWAAF